MPNYFKIGQGNQWLRPASATYDFRISHGTANSARCTSPVALPPLRFPDYNPAKFHCHQTKEVLFKKKIPLIFKNMLSDTCIDKAE